jgi:hypothetical protein
MHQTYAHKMSQFAATAEWVDITPKMAAEFLVQNQGNRKLSLGHTGVLMADMESKNFLITGETIKFDWTGKLIDGQHRLVAIVNSANTQTILVVKGLDPKVQSVIDAQRKRSASSALEFAFADVHNTTTLAAMARFDIMMKNMKNPIATSVISGARLSNSQVIEWVESHMEAMDIATEAKRIGDKLPITPSMVGWLMMKMDVIDSESRSAFFAPLVDRNQPFDAHSEPTEDPRHAYWNALNNMTKHDLVRTLKPVVLATRAWNSWRSGDKMKIMRAVYGGPHGSATPMALETLR